ncbi:MAG: hypothetical protein V1847_03820 [Candidatus Diapherotrites archaeon]
MKEEWMKKMRAFSGKELDLSKDEDLSIALMNLISLEEHLAFSAAKSGGEKFLQMLSEIRPLRKQLLQHFVQESEAEEWCISKHLLAGSMRLFEAGTKELDAGRKEEAQSFFDSAFQLYSLFFALHLKLVPPNEVVAKPVSSGRWAEMVKKLVDCCKE